MSGSQLKLHSRSASATPTFAVLAATADRKKLNVAESLSGEAVASAGETAAMFPSTSAASSSSYVGYSSTA